MPLRDIGDVRLALEGAFDTGASLSVGTAAVARPLWRRALPVAITAVVANLIVGIAGWSLWPTPSPG